MITIEPAKHEDIPRMAGLLGMLFSGHSEFPADPKKQEKGLRMILDDPRWGRILVAREENGRVAGLMNMLFTVSTARGGKAAILEDVILDPAHRGTGLGKRLFNAVLKLAKQEGCDRISLITACDNHRAQRFYKDRGFVQTGCVTMRLEWEK